MGSEPQTQELGLAEDEGVTAMDLVSAIRLRPGMFIGDSTEYGIEHLVYELVANGVDQFLAGRATWVRVSLETPRITVEDDGPGLPYDVSTPTGESLAECYLTRFHRTPTADGHAPHVHISPTGVGLVAVVALSDTVQVVTHRNGVRYEQTFRKGRAVSPPTKVPSLSGLGTKVSFVPDPEIFGEHVPRFPVVRRRLFDAAHLFPGILMELNLERFHGPGGLGDYARFLAASHGAWADGAARFLHVRAECEGILIEAVAFGNSSDGCQWSSWCNGAITCQHGAHVAGFRDALQHVKWQPEAALIHTVMTNPEFSAPTRDKLETPQVRSIVRKVVKESLKVADP